jgi:hypothetical protein
MGLIDFWCSIVLRPKANPQINHKNCAVWRQVDVGGDAAAAPLAISYDLSEEYPTLASPSCTKSQSDPNFGTGDSIDLHNFSASGATLAYNQSSGLLQLSNGGALATLDFQPSTLGGGSFHLAADASGSGLLITRS